MLATLGDLVDDIVVHLESPINVASDTVTRITRRRGGSAANVAAVAARLGKPVRFLGQVGDDPAGRSLVAELASAGVDTSHVRHAGTTGTIVVLVEPGGERSMLTDRRACVDLVDPDASWLDGVTTLHVPLYSLVEPPLRDTTMSVISWARDRSITMSIDLSSVALIAGLGADAVVALLARLAPTVVLANADEALAVGLDRAIGDAVIVVKHGAGPAVVRRPGRRVVEVPATDLEDVDDTTGAGDAFAAGFLTYDGWHRDPAGACAAGHRAAAELISERWRAATRNDGS
jgi:sugar/nucleoside kinase (ribokinase family)